MLTAYAVTGDRLLPGAPLDAAIWIDLYQPEAAEVAVVSALGVEVPSLADMEETHEEWFRQILRGMDEKPPAPGTAGSDPSIREAFFKRIFPADALAEEGDDFGRILEKAMKVEKNAIAFYTEMKKKGDLPSEEEGLDRLIQEERDHLEALSTALDRWRERKFV